MTTTRTRVTAVLLAVALGTALASCTEDDADTATTDDTSSEATAPAEDIDFEALGLWDDGPCDEAAEPLRVGLMTTFESPVISLGDQALALEAAAAAFNERGGANGSCIEVTTCDDRADPNQALECVRLLQEAGVVASINDQGLAAQAEVSDAMAAAGIPRIASNVTNHDWDDPNAYPLDASGTGSTFLMPQALIDAGVTDIGVIRVDSAGSGALVGLLSDLYQEATFSFDTPVAAGTTDYSQFIIGAQDAGVEGVFLALGEQEAVQIIRAAQQLGSELTVAAALGTFSHSSVADLGEFAEQMVFLSPFPPATADLPIYEVLRADLASTGETQLRVENLKVSPMRSWSGLYALLHLIREAGLTEFSGAAITQLLQTATDVPMLDIYGGENWTPNLDHQGLFRRAGMQHWATYRWDPTATAPGGLEGNWVELSTFGWDETVCGSIFGAPAC